MGALLVAGSEHLTPLNSASGHEQRPGMGPVVPSTAGVVVRCPSELAHDDDHRRVQHPSLVQVDQQGGQGLIERRNQRILVLLVVVPVRIPLVELVAGRRHETGSPFRQAPSQEHALAEAVSSVGVSDLFRLPGQFERFPDLRCQNHLQRLLTEPVHGVELGQFHLLAVGGVDHLQHRKPGLQPLDRQSLGEGQIRDGEVGVANRGDVLEAATRRVAQDQGIVFRPQVRALEELLVLPVHVELGGQDIRGHGVYRTQLLGDDGADAGERHGRTGTMPGEHVVRALEVIGFLRADRPDDGDLVHLLGDERTELRHLNPRNVGGNRLERTVRLGIVGVDMTRSTLQPEQDDRFRRGLLLDIHSRTRHQALELKVMREVGSQQAERAQSQEVSSTGEPGIQATHFSQHRWLLLLRLRKKPIGAQWLYANSRELIKAQVRSCRVVFRDGLSSSKRSRRSNSSWLGSLVNASR